MRAPSLYIIRHGHIDARDIFVGQTDVSLSPFGTRQAKALQQLFKDIPLTAAWSSPLQRCRATAEHILQVHPACPLVLEEGLKEISLGSWEGQKKERIRRHDPVWRERGERLFSCAPPGGESLDALGRRVLPAFIAICEQARRHQASMLVAHRSVNQAILAYCLALPQPDMDRISQPYAAVSRIPLNSLELIRLYS